MWQSTDEDSTRLRQPVWLIEARGLPPGGRGRFPKKSDGVLREAAQVKYATMKAHDAEFEVRLMCRVLGVSPSGYYAWRNRAPSKQARGRALLDAQVREDFERRKGRAGAPRLSRHLGRGRRQVAQSLRRQGLRAKAAKKFKAPRTPNTRCRWPRTC